MGSSAVFTFLIIALAAFTPAAHATPESPAATPQVSEQLAQQRESYKKALAALRRGSQRDYKRQLRQLDDYPLLPYLQYTDLSIRIRRLPRDQINDFLTQYDGTSIADRLRIRWLKELKRRKRGTEYIANFQESVADTELTCYYHYARHQTGTAVEQEEALLNAETLWLVGKSQPKGCDPLFDILIDQKRISSELAWQRFTLALNNRKTSLARYLERFITEQPYQSYAKQAMAVAQQPARISRYNYYSSHDPHMMSIIETALIRLASANASRALKEWAHYQQTHPFSVASKRKVTERIIKALYKQQQQRAADEYLASSTDLVEPPLLEWRIRQALLDQDWDGALAWIEKLPWEYREDERWQYWHARLSQQLKNSDPTETYQTLAKRRNFYGFLASDYLGTPYAMEHQSVIVSDTRVAQIEQRADIQRARELRFHGERLNARREWRDAGRHFDEQDWQAAAIVAKGWGWYSQSIWSMIRASHWNDLELRFPLYQFDIIKENTDSLKMEAHLLMALARQESALAEDAVSPVGARGLMQLMPATAKQTARKHGIKYRSKNELFTPSKNIALGTRYYRDMLTRFDDNRILATAAYNAGPHRVKRWREKSGGNLPFDVWIETIPFKETRGYVQNVLAFSAIYAYRLNFTAPILSERELQMTL